jgi:hypothetical protein
MCHRAALQVVSEATGIPVQKLSRSDAQALSHLECDLSDQVVGQAQAVAGAARAVRLWRSGLLGSTSERPAVSLLLTGPAGVGKRTLCKVGGYNADMLPMHRLPGMQHEQSALVQALFPFSCFGIGMVH